MRMRKNCRPSATSSSTSRRSSRSSNRRIGAIIFRKARRLTEPSVFFKPTVRRKLQIARLQAPKKLQAPNPKAGISHYSFWSLGFGISLELGAWDLELPRATAFRGCTRHRPAQTETVNFALFERPLFYVGGHYISFLG